MDYIYNNERIPTHFIKTDKFKTNTISIRFASNIDRSRITERVLLPSILYSGSRKYNSKRKINLLMEEMYDSSISFSMSKLGLSSVINISVSFVSDSYLKEPMVEDIVDFLNEVIFNPFVENEEFRQSSVDEEKRLLKEYFDSIKDDKTEYALRRMKEHLYGVEEFGISAIGYLEDLENIDGKTLYQEYLRMIQTDSAEIIITGDYENTDFLNKLDLSGNHQVTVIDKPKDTRPLREITETMKLNQAKLNLGLRTGITHDSELYIPMIVANSVLGSSPNNLLFKTVREEHSLCYYIRSAYIPFNGAMYIYSGVSDSNIQKATKLILNEIENLKQGRFDSELLINSKKVLINDLLESLDRQSAIGGRVYLYNQVGKVFDLYKIMDDINAVSKKQVMEVASHIELELKYALSNKEDVWND